MLLINCKVELKLKCTKYCFFSPAGGENDNDVPNNIIFTEWNKIIYSCSNFISKRSSKTIKTS